MIVTVAIVEDDPQVRDWLQQLIDSTPGYRCVCTCETTQAALSKIPRARPKIVLMDINLPGGSGVDCTFRLKQTMPELQIIMLTVFRDSTKLFQSLKAGASGYLLKRRSAEDILAAIAEVRNGGAPMSPEIARMVVETFHTPVAGKTMSPDTESLSAREEEVLKLLGQGLVNKEIGEQLGISKDTVRAHLRKIYEKLHVRCRIEAINQYRRQIDNAAKVP